MGSWAATSAFIQDENERVTLCIPTWESETFIGAAIDCATAQTYKNLQILISVDRSEDGTVDICRDRTRTDGRVRVLEQTTRLGWTENINALLDAVETDYYAIYFHDDAVSPDWISILMDRLRERPDAGAAYCAITEGDTLNCGQDHDGSTFARLMTRLVRVPKGSPLRALTRKSALNKPARFPKVSLLGYHAQHAYLFDLIAGAPLLFVPKTLYFRQHERVGGVTNNWKTMPPFEIEEDLKATAAAISDSISTRFQDRCRRALLEECAKLLLLLQFTRSDVHHGIRRQISLDDVLPGCNGAEAETWLSSECPEFLKGYKLLKGQLVAAMARKPNLDWEQHENAAP